MKAIVSVCRTAYAHNNITVEIPDGQLYRVAKKSGKKYRLHPHRIAKLLEEKALEQAGDHEYSEHSSEYEVVGLNPYVKS